eukprot:756452-Hanusia_phi.AAC.1
MLPEEASLTRLHSDPPRASQCFCRNPACLLHPATRQASGGGRRRSRGRAMSGEEGQRERETNGSREVRGRVGARGRGCLFQP